MQKYDSIIIGSGQAGVPLSVNLNQKGEEVALIEKKYLGGSCVNYGCTPSKAMISSARRAWIAKNSEYHGVTADKVEVNLNKIVERKNKIVQNFREGLQKKVDKKNLDLYREHGKFVEDHRVKVGNKTIEGEKIFINTGAKPFVPPIDGLDDINYLTSTSVMELKDTPEHLIIIGGGYIGLEFGQAFSRFGSKVSIIERGSQLVSHEDPDIAEKIKEIMQQEGVEIHLNSETEKVESHNDDVKVKIEKDNEQKTLKGAHLLVATGRVPATDELGLENTNIETTDRGHIKTNKKLETNVEKVWALGDVKGGPAFTHVSYNDYEIVFDNLYGEEKLTVEDRLLVYAMFIDPQLGRAGLSEKQAEKKELDYEVVEYPMSSVARAIELGETQGKMKLIVDKNTRNILGASVLGYEGAEVIQTLAAYMNSDAKVDQVQEAIAIHPTIIEGVQSLARKVD